MTPQAVVDELTYRNYRYNRQLRPDITPVDWARVYGETTTMEERYQEEVDDAVTETV